MSVSRGNWFYIRASRDSRQDYFFRALTKLYHDTTENIRSRPILVRKMRLARKLGCC